MNRFVVLAIAVFAVVALWCGGWFFGASWLRGEIEARAASEPSIACAELAIAGFPFRYDITCTGATVTDLDVQLSVDELRASVLVYNPTFAEIFARGPATLSDAFTGAAYRLDWQSLQASVRLDWTALNRASLVAEGLVLTDTVLDPIEMARVGHLELHALGTEGATGAERRNLRLYARLQNAEAPQVDAPVDAEASALVTEWPADIRSWGARDVLPYWAGGGGALLVEQAKVTTGELSADIQGSLAPDPAGRIDGSLTLASRGFGPLLRDYMAAPLANVLLGPEDPDGVAHQTLVISHSILRAGIVPLLEFPPLF